jgi:16S rRNA G966 N2-methylase RsmD
LGEAFDLILLDPPYEAPEIGAILSAMTRSLRENGTIVLERSRRVSVEHSADLNPVRSLKSGDSVLDFYQLRKKACDE